MVTVRLTASLSPPTTRYDESPTAHGRVTNLGDQRHRAGGVRVRFEHEHLAVFDGVLHVHEAAHVESFGNLPRVILDGREVLTPFPQRG